MIKAIMKSSTLATLLLLAIVCLAGCSSINQNQEIWVATTVTDFTGPAKTIKTYEVDASGNVLSITAEQDGSPWYSTTISRDENGFSIKEETENYSVGQNTVVNIDWQFDSSGKPLAKHAVSSEFEETETYTYNENGILETISTQHHDKLFLDRDYLIVTDYDLNGYPTESNMTYNNTPEWNTSTSYSYVYDLAGNVTSSTTTSQGSSFVTQYERNSDGFIVKTTDDSGETLFTQEGIQIENPSPATAFFSSIH